VRRALAGFYALAVCLDRLSDLPERPQQQEQGITKMRALSLTIVFLVASFSAIPAMAVPDSFFDVYTDWFSAELGGGLNPSRIAALSDCT
jgi:hypothetical protein